MKKFDQELYKKNIDALKKANLQHLVEWIEKEKDAEWVKPVKAKNDLMNFLVHQGSKSITAYDNKSPRSNILKTIKNMDLGKTSATIINGIGLGYLSHSILSKKEKEHILIIVEPTATLIKHAFSMFDFTKYILNMSFIIAVGREEFTFLISMIESTKVIESWGIFTEGYTFNIPHVYGEISVFTTEVINQLRCNVGTIMGAGEEIAHNDIKNIPYIFRHTGVNKLEDIYKDKPAVIISTGPSLKKNLHFLIDNRDKIIVIAVAQALRLLLAYDIRPDFICTVDYGKVNYSHFNGLWDSDIPLVCLNRTYAPIIKEWQGPKYISVSFSPGDDKSAIGVMQEKGSLEQGGSVSHFCLGLALKLGCKNIAIIGQDLSYEGNRSHFAQADASGKIAIAENGQISWKVDDPNSHLKDIDVDMGFSIQVPGYMGGIVSTNMGLASFISTFEKMAELYPENNIHNCTEGGAKIKGTIQMSFQKFLKTFATKKIKRKLPDTIDKDFDIDKLIAALRYDIKSFESVKENSEKGLTPIYKAQKIAKSSKKMKRESNKLNALIMENEKYSTLAHNEAKKNQLLGVAIYKASREIQGKELSVSGRMSVLMKDAEILRTRIRRNILILTAAKEGAEKLLDLYENTLDIVAEYRYTKNEKLITDFKECFSDLKDAEKYFAIENYAYPLHAARKTKSKEYLTILFKALAMRDKEIEESKQLPDKTKEIEYLNYIEEAQNLGRDKDNFEAALEKLLLAKKLFPEKIESHWGLANTYHALNKYEESGKEYEWLIKNYPENLKFQFEYGTVLLYTDTEKGIKTIVKVMEKTKEFDHFLYRIGQLQEKAGNHKDAIDAYEQYIKTFPDNFHIWERISHCYEVIGNIEKSKKALEKYTALCPD